MISDPSLLWLVIVSGIACFFMAFVTGANDIANTFSTSIGSKAITLGKAIIIAFIFETIGACLLGGTVTDSIRTKIINFDSFEDGPEFLMLGMCCALIGASLWLAIATFAGIPVSTTHSIVGALTGFGLATGKIKSIRWNKIYNILIAWIMAPILAGSFSAVTFILLRKFILRNKNSSIIIKKMYWILIFMITLPFSVFLIYHNPITLDIDCLMFRDGKYVTTNPCYIQEWSVANLLYSIISCFVLSSILTLITSFIVYRIYTQRIDHYRLNKSVLEESSLDIEKNAIGLDIYNLKNSSLSSDTSNDTQNTQIDENVIGNKKVGIKGKENKKKGYKNYFTTKRMQYESHMMNDNEGEKSIVTMEDINIEKFDTETEIVFSALQIISAILGVIAQSANDTANAIGPFAAVFNTYKNGLKGKLKVQWYILLFGGLSMSMGLAILGYKVIKTVGMKLIKMTPSRGFTVELVAGLVVLFFSIAGIPLSSTHCAVSSVVGVGLVELRMGKHKTKITDSSNEIIIDTNGKTNKLDQEIEKKSCFSCLNSSCVNLKLFRTVFLSWIITVLFSASVTAAIFSFAAYSPGYKI